MKDLEGLEDLEGLYWQEVRQTSRATTILSILSQARLIEYLEDIVEEEIVIFINILGLIIFIYVNTFH